jgi:DNA polymerase I
MIAPVPTILGIDGTNWIHQLWHALGGRGVVEAACNRTAALVQELEPQTVVICWDRRSFRHDLEPRYKSGRKEKDQSLVRDLADAEGALRPFGLSAAEDGYEADDCLATLAAYGRQSGLRTVIASPDKDLRQCLGGQVFLLRAFSTQAGKPLRPDWYTTVSLFDDYGLEPRQWVDYQCLVGDRSDAIDGCQGWGEKTAAKVLGKCKTLEVCFANPWAVPCSDKQRGELIKFRERAPIVRQLVTLKTDVAAVWDLMR